jgi:bacterioferritin
MRDFQTKQTVYNLADIKKEAKEHLDKGAVTHDYPLDVHEACRLLNEALATEIMCVLRYRHHQIIAKGIDSIQVSAEFAEHALEEEQHMMMVAERINQLGGDPDFNPTTVGQRSAADYGTGIDLVTLIQEDLIAERIAIDVYRKMIAWFGTADPTTRRILEVILEQEEEHADDLANLLARQRLHQAS